MVSQSVRFPVLLFAAVAICSMALSACTSWKKATAEFHEELNRQYRDPKDSPLDSLSRKQFSHHDFFPISGAYRLRVDWVRTPDEQPFEMPTVSGKTKTFVKYGELHFTLNGRPDTLSAYQNLKLAQDPKFADELFIPFKDHCSGEEAYGGGRYIDWKIPTSSRPWLDFNLCYNPYCAYSTGWNCPIPPEENYVDSPVRAGVKNPH